MNPLELKALYYPYARCINEATLKRAILIFDEIGFVDPTNSSMRANLIEDEEIPRHVSENWNTVSDAYGLLMDRGIVKLHDPGTLVHKHDQLLGAALKADLDDDNVWKLCTGPGTPETWSILRRKVPSSAFGYLNSQHAARINYGTAKAKAFFHGEFLEWPNLKNENLQSAHGAFNLHEGNWFRYLFHDGRVARERNAQRIRGRKAREKYLNEGELSCIFPFTHGSSLAVNTALLLADDHGLVPFTDSRLHPEILATKFHRISVSRPTENLLSGVRPLNSEKLRRITYTLLEAIVPEEIIESMSIADSVRYREASVEAFRRLKIYIGELVSQIESEPFTDKFEQDIQRLIYQKVKPEAQRAQDEGLKVYDKLFSKLGRRAVSALTPTLGATMMAGVSSLSMLLIMSASAAGVILPDLLDAWSKERSARRNSFSYLLELK